MNMKKNKSILWLTLAICMLISFFLYHRHEACRYSLQIIETENEGGYGYRILCGDRVVICQPYIPSLPGRKGFASEEDARKQMDSFTGLTENRYLKMYLQTGE